MRCESARPMSNIARQGRSAAAFHAQTSRLSEPRIFESEAAAAVSAALLISTANCIGEMDSTQGNSALLPPTAPSVPKTKASVRVIPLSDPVLRALRLWR